MTFSLAASFWQDSAGLLARAWAYLTQSFTFGRITVSLSSVIVGVAVFTLTRVQFLKFGDYSLYFRLLQD